MSRVINNRIFANRISISIVKLRRKQTNAWLQAKHDEIDERRGGDAYLGLDAVLAAPLNRITVIFFLKKPFSFHYSLLFDFFFC